MAKAYFIPADDKSKSTWLSNLAGKLGTYAALSVTGRDGSTRSP
jgi:hypothetical protein